MKQSRKEMSARNDTIKNYLTDISRDSEWWVYGFVLAHGKRFGKIVPLPEGVEQGARQKCFLNAFLLTTKYPELVYVEGFFRKILGKGFDIIDIIRGLSIRREMFMTRRGREKSISESHSSQNMCRER